MADAIFSPLPLYLDILKSEHWTLPDSQYRLQPNSQKKKDARSAEKANNDATTIATNAASSKTIEEIVYLGVMEERDGLSVFCNALDKAADSIPKDCRITFLGSSTATAGRNAESYIVTRAQKWSWSWQFIHADKQSESIEYLKHGSKLAILGSSTTTSLLLAYECVLNGISCLCNEESKGKIAADYNFLAPYFFADEAGLLTRLRQFQSLSGEENKPRINIERPEALVG